MNFCRIAMVLARESTSRLMLFILFVLLHPSLVYPQTVEVTPLNGKILRGTLVSIADRQVTLKVGSGEEKYSFGELDAIRMLSPVKASDKSTADLLTLVDGSEIICREFNGSDDQWKARVLGAGELAFPKGSVEAIRFGQPAQALQQQWRVAIEEERSSDQLVIVRPGDTTDVAPGLIGQVNTTAVDFSFDGQSIQAPRAKLLGILWYRQRNKRIEPTIQIRLVDGSKWLATETNLTAAEATGMRWKTKSDIESSCRWEDIETIDFSSANVVWLASQSPIEVETFQLSLMKSELASRQLLLGPRFITVGGEDQAKSKDLCFKGPGRIVFRVPEGFNRFVARVHRSETAKYLSPVVLEVRDGDQVAWKEDFAPNQEELKVDVAVTAGKKLSLTVSCDSELMIGTELFWDQPRLTR